MSLFFSILAIAVVFTAIVAFFNYLIIKYMINSYDRYMDDMLSSFEAMDRAQGIAMPQPYEVTNERIEEVRSLFENTELFDEITIEVEVDLDKFDTDDLEEEVCSRLGVTLLLETKIKTLDDKFKWEHLVKVFDKYTSTEIETLLNK